VVNDEQTELIVDEASTAMPQLIEVCKAAHLTVTMIEETIPSFDDVFVRIIETARANA
jgi:hypothetical protein